MTIDLTQGDFKEIRDAVVTGVFLHYFDQDIRKIPAIILTIIKNGNYYRLEISHANRYICNCDCSTQKWIKDILYENDGKIRIRLYTIFQVMEYPDLVYSEIVCVGRNIELNMVNIQKEVQKDGQ
jgi:hypothetical protein